MVEIIEKGILKKKEEQGFQFMNYNISYLDVSYIDKMMELKELIMKRLENPEIFISASKKVILEDVLKPGKGLAIGVFVEGELIAYRTVKFSGEIIQKMVNKLEFFQEDMDKIVYLQSTVVHPNFRGNALQIKTLKIILDLSLQKGYKYVTATISPYNYHSLKNILSYGITIRDILTLGGNYKDKKRFIMYKDLTLQNKQQYEEVIAIAHQDINLHIDILKKGYIGFNIQDTENGYDIIFGK
ncbi:hypothetical protein [Garciella nitratireducens]|uniref:N-acetyltransferase domain-containing protein n=1 Tax=Garciella nitratireducens DSM 15102 TaxID=1121911 RepID=A0A1T4PIE9_9FIRM|nr:hypothetical protein [Garciella nitratireducens]RBP37594.1 hypothetical protein DFR81_1235 [Garciella nitratireducens]SJZ91365.1 hypothetical protein SAMN02745973_02108 [Garciella nitratireducens DSM 15102]